VDEDEIIKVVLVNLSKRNSIGMWPVYVDQEGAEGKTTLCIAMILLQCPFSCVYMRFHTSCADIAALLLVILDPLAMKFSV
jgi:hypothetical protein